LAPRLRIHPTFLRALKLSFAGQVSLVTFWASAPTSLPSLLWYGSCLELVARIAKMKCNASGEQADGLTCGDVFRCADLCDFCNALEFF